MPLKAVIKLYQEVLLEVELSKVSMAAPPAATAALQPAAWPTQGTGEVLRIRTDGVSASEVKTRRPAAVPEPTEGLPTSVMLISEIMSKADKPVEVPMPTFLPTVSMLKTKEEAPLNKETAEVEETFWTNPPYAVKPPRSCPPEEYRLSKLPVWAAPAVMSMPELAEVWVVSISNTGEAEPFFMDTAVVEEMSWTKPPYGEIFTILEPVVEAARKRSTVWPALCRNKRLVGEVVPMPILPLVRMVIKYVGVVPYDEAIGFVAKLMGTLPREVNSYWPALTSKLKALEASS